MVVTTTWTSATVGQGGTSNLQGFQAHHPPIYIGGGDSIVRTTLAIKREVEDARSIRDTGASGKRKSLLLVRERSRRFLLPEDFRDGDEAIRAKAILGPDQGFYPARIDDMLFLPSAWTYEAGLPLEARISWYWDGAVPIISGTGADVVCSFSP